MSISIRRWRQWKRKKVAFVSVILLVVIGVFSFSRKTPETPRFRVREADFHVIPYRTIARCDLEANGKINCPDIRHNGTTLLRRAQLVLTRLLKIFDLIAKKYGVRYWLFKGTLLGAVRHHGHNPFDDDVDICIPKAEFEKFIKYGVKDLPEDIFFQTVETDVHYKVPIHSGIHGKLRDKRSCYKTCLNIGCKHMDGLQMDVYVVENDSDGKRFVESYSHPGLFTEHVTDTPLSPTAGNESEVFPLTEVNFDGFLLPAPRMWKKILKSFYGDFMTIPYDKAPGHTVTDALRSCEEIKKSRSWLNSLKKLIGM